MTLSDAWEQILDATMSGNAHDGIEGASMRDAAREADVSLGPLSYHFDDELESGLDRCDSIALAP